ncbi:MAG: DEAD/DEAH box helicase family protein [Syntrophothermus sp.]|uniref:DEAD/DEAH box helicase family protein n=1 Tax=Syntrophothermus sp. TaxID=2736299 RepID=UPI00257DB07A|nr:DEAD/DEAH box helicase family protein [Syntrophothermus sp.]NSW83635.1 DEAD/DEAH box helicase family protein [Syntrophothermus sp.]
MAWHLTYYGGKESFYGFCDLVARKGNVPYFISIYGPVSVVQGLVAAMQTNRFVYLRDPAYDDAPYYIKERFKVGLHCQHRFKSFMAKTPSGMGHAILVAEQAFDSRDSETVLFSWDGNLLESFWQALDKNYSCPVLKGWLPYLWEKAEAKEYIEELEVEDFTKEKRHNLAAALLNMTEEGLREIVQEGLKSGEIAINGYNARNFKPEKSKLSRVKNLEDYLFTYKEELDRQVLEATVPLHDPAKDGWHEGLKDLLRKPFRMQGHVVTALNKLLKKQDHAFLVAEQGAGKTLMGSALAYLLATEKKQIRVLVMCPPHLVGKWKTEIEITVPGAKAVVIRNYAELCKIHRESPKQPAGYEFYIISRETAKLGYYLKPAAKWSKRLKGWVCPDCGRLLGNKADDGEIDPWGKEAFAKRTNKNSYCPHCQEDAKLIEAEAEEKKPPRSVTNRGFLWAPNVTTYKTSEADGLFPTEEEPVLVKTGGMQVRRYPPAEYIKRKMKNWFDLLLIDEVHELKGDHTAQGNALGMLASAVKKKVALTGTLFGGKSSNVFYLLWRLAPQLMKKSGYEYKDLRRWVEHYGITETTTKYKDEIEYNRASRGQTKGHTTQKELPGISPSLYPNFLMRNCVFLSLSEIEDLELPEYTEQVVQVNMGNLLGEAYQQFIGNLHLQVKAHLARGDKSLLGSYLVNGLAYPDAPFDAQPVIHPHTKELVAVPDILSDDVLYPKEEVLLDIIRKEIARNRKCFVYMQYTGTRDMAPRIEKILLQAGIKAVSLKATTSPEKRMEWINKAVEEGAQVIIGNPALVSTGLDLYDFPTLIFYQCGYNLYQLRQASRRSLRPFQKQDVKVIFMAYNNSMQADALSLMGEKLEAAMSIEGKWSEEGLRSMGKAVQDVRVALAKRLYEEDARKLESAAAKWERMYGRKPQAAELGQLVLFKLGEAEPVPAVRTKVTIRRRAQKQAGLAGEQLSLFAI